MTELVHGADAATARPRPSRGALRRRRPRGLDPATLESAFADLPRAEIASGNGMPTVARPARRRRGCPTAAARRDASSPRAAPTSTIVRVTDPAAVPDPIGPACRAMAAAAARKAPARRGRGARAVNLAFVTGAIASGLAAAGVTALCIWIATVVTGSSDPWSLGPWLIPGVAAVIGVATFVAERYLHRADGRAQAGDRRAVGLPRIAPPSGRRARTRRGRSLRRPRRPSRRCCSAPRRSGRPAS